MLNSIQKLSLAAILVVITGSGALCQSPVADLTGPPVSEGTPLPLVGAVLNRVTLRKDVDVQIGNGNATTYQLATKAVFVSASGEVLHPAAISALPRNTRVALHFMEDGDKVVVDRVFVR